MHYGLVVGALVIFVWSHVLPFSRREGKLVHVLHTFLVWQVLLFFESFSACFIGRDVAFPVLPVLLYAGFVPYLGFATREEIAEKWWEATHFLPLSAFVLLLGFGTWGIFTMEGPFTASIFVAANLALYFLSWNFKRYWWVIVLQALLALGIGIYLAYPGFVKPFIALGITAGVSFVKLYRQP